MAAEKIKGTKSNENKSISLLHILITPLVISFLINIKTLCHNIGHFEITVENFSLRGIGDGKNPRRNG